MAALGHYEIKVFADRDALDGNAAAGLSEAGEVTVTLRNLTQSAELLTTPITIDAGEFSSYAPGTTQPVIDDDVVMDKGDRISVNVDAADGTAEGLVVILTFAAR